MSLQHGPIQAHAYTASVLQVGAYTAITTTKKDQRAPVSTSKKIDEQQMEGGGVDPSRLVTPLDILRAMSSKWRGLLG